jgi:hypothetical protein
MRAGIESPKAAREAKRIEQQQAKARKADAKKLAKAAKKVSPR